MWFPSSTSASSIGDTADMAVVLLEGSGDSGPEFELAVPVQLLDLARRVKEVSKGLPL
jgi:hypothetical protein